MLGLQEGRIVPIEEKVRPEYGYKAVSNMWSTYSNSPIGVGYNSIDYIKNMDLALGRPSQFRENISKFLGARNNEMLSSYGINSIDPQLVNLCPKFVNHVHGKLMNFEYEIGVDVIDATSVDEKQQIRAELEAYVKLKDFFAGIGVQVEQLKKESGIEELPETQEDVELIMTTTYKHHEAMRAEIELKKIHNLNDWNAIKSKFIWELIVQGQSGVRTFVDEYGTIREEWFPMNRFVSSYSESEDFNKLTHAGIIDYITVDQFYAEAKDSMTESEIFDVIKNHTTTSMGMASENPTFITPQATGNVKYVKIMRFQFIEEDIENYVKKKDKNGNWGHEKKSPNFSIAPEEKHFYESGEKIHIQTCVKTKYGGTWVVGTKNVYDYGIIQQGNDVRLDYHVYAPNMRNGRVVSMVAQIREPLEMISIAWSRYKDVLGKGYNGLLEINIDLLADLTLGKGGTAPNWKNALDLFTINGIVLSKSKRNVHDQNVGKAIDILNQGLGAGDFVSAIELSINMIRNICGINELSDGSTPAAGTLNGVMQMSNQATDNNLQYFYRAYNSVYRRTSLAILGYWKSIPSNEAWTREYVIGVEAATTQEEWATFYASLDRQTQIPLIDGGLKYADFIELHNVKNLKQAELMAKNRCRKNMAEARAMQAEQMKQQQDQSTQAAQMANEAKMQQMQLELDLFKQREAFLTQEIIKRQEKVNEGIILGKQVSNEGALEVANTNMKATVVKEAQRSNSDQTIQSMKNQMEEMRAILEREMHDLEMRIKESEAKDKKEDSSENKSTKS